MSKNIEENRDFLKLFLKTTREQQKFLINSLTDSQVHVLKEIIYNLPHLSLPRKYLTLLKKRSFQLLSKKKTPLKQARRLLKRNYKDTILLINAAKSQLDELLLRRQLQ